MIEELLQSLAVDVLRVLKGKEEIDDKTMGSTALAKPLQAMNPDQLVDQFALLLKTLKEEMPFSKNAFTDALGSFFLQEFSVPFDQMGSHFFHQKLSVQESMLKKYFPFSSYFFDHLRSHLLFASQQDITETIVQYTSSLYGSPRILVQSPVECEVHLKHSIRQHFLQFYSQSFLAFHVNTQLIGGIRFFVDGTVQDFSWFSHIQALHSFSSHL